MTILFVGSVVEAYTCPNGYNLNTEYDAAFSYTSFQPGTSSGDPSAYCASPVFAAQTSLWMHMAFRQTLNASNVTSTTKVFAFVNSSGTEVFRLIASGTQLYQPQFWNGSTWTNTGTAFNVGTNNIDKWDVFIECGVSGSYEIWMNNILVASGSITDADTDDVAQIRLYQASSGSNTQRAHYSEVIVATEPTFDWRVFSRKPSGNGNYTTWAGSYTDVDENGFSDTDFISGTTNDEKESYTTSARTIGSYEVKGINVAIRARRDTGGPQNVNVMLRNGSTDHFSSNLSNLLTAFGPLQYTWELDPTSGVKWTPTDAGNATLNFGVRAVT